MKEELSIEEKRVLSYILEKANNIFDKNVIIELPDESIIPEKIFGSIIFKLGLFGYLNNHSIFSDRKIEGVEIRKLIVNISRNSKSFIKPGGALE